MSGSNLAIILASALVHVVAHLALKQARDRTAFVWWMLLWGGVLFLPVLVYFQGPIPPAVWLIMAASAVFEAAYFFSIAQAYRTGDLSVVYPLARGTAPLWLLVWSLAVLRERLTGGGVAGVLLIAGGLYAINLPRLGAWSEPLRALAQPAPRWALLAGLCISLYTALDRVAVQQADPLLYTYLALWLTAGVMTPGVLRQVGWARLRAELLSARLSSVVAGFTTMTAYAMVLYAMRGGVPAGYAGAVREISVVLGALAGIVLLREPGGPMRLLGAAGVAAGVVTVALLG